MEQNQFVCLVEEDHEFSFGYDEFEMSLNQSKRSYQGLWLYESTAQSTGYR